MKKITTILLLFSVLLSSAQDFTRKDSLRGELTPSRTCYDVTFYDLFLIIDIPERSIERSFNEIYFLATTDFTEFQIDLALNMEVQKIEFENGELEFSRKFDAVFVCDMRELERLESMRNAPPAPTAESGPLSFRTSGESDG